MQHVRALSGVQPFPCCLHCHLASGEGIVTLGVTLSRCVCVRRINLGSKGNALYPLLSSFLYKKQFAHSCGL